MNRVEGVKLLPCPNPWCKGEFGPNAIRWPVTANKTTQWAVYCDDCDLYGPVGETEAEAIALWNIRPSLEADEPTAAMLRAGKAAAKHWGVRYAVNDALTAIYRAMSQARLSGEGGE